MRSPVARSNRVPANADARLGAAGSRPASGWVGRIGPLLLAALGLLVYANSFAAPFVYDGIAFILENASLRQLNPLAMTEGKSRPVSYYTFALNYAVDGYHERGYHAVNLAIHVAAACTLFGLARRTLKYSPRCANRYAASADGLALAIAALWLVHPIQTASVTYIYQRQESLMGLFYLLTLYCTVRGIQASGDGHAAHPWSSRKWSCAAVAASLLGMGTKEVMVTAPLMALWYDRVFWASSWREVFERRKWLYAALFATAAFPIGFLLFKAKEYQDVGLMVNVYTRWEYARSQPGVVCHYLWLCFDPRGLCLDPNWQVATTTAEIHYPFLAIGLLLILTAWCVWRYPGWGFLGAWFFIILSPTSTVLPILDLAYDHRMYLSLASVVVLAVLGGYEARRWLAARTESSLLRQNWLPVAIMLFIVCVFGLQTIIRNEDYHSTIAIWEDTVKKAPHNARAHYSLGRDLHAMAQGDPRVETMALEQADAALKNVPEYSDAHGLRGTVMERLGSNIASEARSAEVEGHKEQAEKLNDESKRMLEEAESEFRWVTEHDSDKRVSHKADGWANLGNVFARRNKPEEAIEHYDHALKLDPNNALAHSNRGLALLQLQRADEGVAELRRGIELEPIAHPNWYYMLAAALAARGHADDAIRVLNEAVARNIADVDIYCELGIFERRKENWAQAEQSFLRGLALVPDDIPTLLNLADLLSMRGRTSEAIQRCRQALVKHPDHPNAHALLGQILAQTGANDEAVEHFRKALAVVPDHTAAKEGLEKLTGPKTPQ